MAAVRGLRLVFDSVVEDGPLIALLESTLGRAALVAQSAPQRRYEPKRLAQRTIESLSAARAAAWQRAKEWDLEQQRLRERLELVGTRFDNGDVEIAVQYYGPCSWCRRGCTQHKSLLQRQHIISAPLDVLDCRSYCWLGQPSQIPDRDRDQRGDCER